MQIAIKDIKIPPRFRKDLGDISSLMASIEELGLLQPIGITKTKVLVYGMRRLTACKKLGWNKIDSVWVDLNEYLLKVAELSENVKRKNMTWKEEAEAIVEIDKTKRRVYGEPKIGHRTDLNGPLSESDKGWNQQKTANSLNIHQSKVSEAYTIVDYAEKYERVADSSTWYGALSHVKEIKEKEYRESIDLPQYENFVLEDCLNVIPNLENESIRCIVTDPPYGINYVTGKREKESELVKPIEGDNPVEIIDLLDKSLSLLKEKMLPDSALYLFTNWKAYPFIYSIIKEYFKIRNLLVWVKSRWASGVIEYQYVPQHELIIYATKGKPTLFEGRQFDVLNYDIVKSRERIHPTQKPIDLLKYLIKRSTVEKELIVDPFAGVGSTAIAAIETNRSWFCVEIDSDYYSKAILRVKEAYKCH